MNIRDFEETGILVEEILYQDALNMFETFAHQFGAIFLDSSQYDSRLGRYSYIGIDPFLTFSVKNGTITGIEDPDKGSPFAILRQWMQQFILPYRPEYPPFVGGLAGLFSYDSAHYLEALPQPKFDDLKYLDMAIGAYDLVIAFDHNVQKSWIFSSGFPCVSGQERLNRATSRMLWMLNQLKRGSALLPLKEKGASSHAIASNMTPKEYRQGVEQFKAHILSGDIFEGTMSQRFKTTLPKGWTAFDCYRRLRHFNPAPFAAFQNWGAFKVASASPERFLRLHQKAVETRPIKGTRPRGQGAIEDQRLAQELIHSEKDWAENVMIVDLLRNDLSRVCEDHSILVPQLCQLESFASVHHLVSVVQGTLLPSLNAIDVLCASFPGGSVTGAPKIRAMEVIAKIEPTLRGPYCGSMAYIGFNGEMDSSIMIRSYGIQKDWVTFQAGGAITLDSCAHSEYEESLDKARALKRALVENVS